MDINAEIDRNLPPPKRDGPPIHLPTVPLGQELLIRTLQKCAARSEAMKLSQEYIGEHEEVLGLAAIRLEFTMEKAKQLMLSMREGKLDLFGLTRPSRGGREGEEAQRVEDG